MWQSFGYKDLMRTETGRTSKPGLARVDVEANGCRTLWANNVYGALTMGPNTTVYVGMLGGIVSIRDTDGPGLRNATWYSDKR